AREGVRDAANRFPRLPVFRARGLVAVSRARAPHHRADGAVVGAVRRARAGGRGPLDGELRVASARGAARDQRCGAGPAARRGMDRRVPARTGSGRGGRLPRAHHTGRGAGCASSRAPQHPAGDRDPPRRGAHGRWRAKRRGARPGRPQLAPPAPAALQAAQLDAVRQATLGEYEILGELGRGGMATVYLAHDIALDRQVAIKVMAPALLAGEGMAERFKREARTAASLSHPNIIPIYAVRETEQTLYFVMKLIEGRPLDSIIHEIGPLPIPMVQAIVHQVGSALGYAHKRGVVHRDVKAANVMVDSDGWAVV